MLALLDRDGVINVDLPQGVHSIQDFALIPQSAQAIQRLNAAGMPVAVVTNQALVGRGEITPDQLHDIHKHMLALLKKSDAHIDHIFYCTDTQIVPHNRRKPAPGMLLEAMQYFRKSPQETVMIGDARRDLEAAAAAGCQRILVKTGKGQKTLQEDLTALEPLNVFDNLWYASQFLVEQQ